MLALRLDYRRLWLQILLALTTISLTLALDTLTGNVVLDGTLVAMLGLYLAAQPARNTIDTLFADRFALAMLWSRWAGKGWLALNGVVLVLGCATITLGIARLIGA